MFYALAACIVTSVGNDFKEIFDYIKHGCRGTQTVTMFSACSYRISLHVLLSVVPVLDNTL